VLDSMKQYLESSNYIDWDHPEVLAAAQRLAQGAENLAEVVRACFEFVRDEIKHSWDYRLNPVTCKASEVLQYGTGYCFAKSHLLAALLRANQIPTGLCYQRLALDDRPLFSLHGLNVAFLETYGWYRIDARGNKPGVEAEFCPPVEKLAYQITVEGEADLPEICSEPLSVIVECLEQGQTYLEVAENLPDISLPYTLNEGTNIYHE